MENTKPSGLKSGDRVLTRLVSSLGFGTIVPMVGGIGLTPLGAAMVGEIGVKWDCMLVAQWHETSDLINVGEVRP